VQHSDREYLPFVSHILRRRNESRNNAAITSLYVTDKSSPQGKCMYIYPRGRGGGGIAEALRKNVPSARILSVHCCARRCIRGIKLSQGKIARYSEAREEEGRYEEERDWLLFHGPTRKVDLLAPSPIDKLCGPPAQGPFLPRRRGETPLHRGGREWGKLGPAMKPPRRISYPLQIADYPASFHTPPRPLLSFSLLCRATS